MEEKSLERQVLVALTTHMIEESIRDFVRSHGDAFKMVHLPANAEQVRLLGLDLVEEAVAALKAKAQQAEKKQQ